MPSLKNSFASLNILNTFMTIGSAFMNGGRVASPVPLSRLLCSLCVVIGSVSSLVFVVPSVEIIVEQNNATRRHTSDDASAKGDEDKERK